MITVVEVFDCPMCCSTGACGPQVDAVLAQFAMGIDWLADEGIATDRNNLAQQSEVFVANETAKAILASEGSARMPLILVSGKLAGKGRYPSREEVAQFVKKKP